LIGGNWEAPWGSASQTRTCSEAKRLIGRPGKRPGFAEEHTRQ